MSEDSDPYLWNGFNIKSPSERQESLNSPSFFGKYLSYCNLWRRLLNNKMLDCWEMLCFNKLLLLKTTKSHVLSCYAKCGHTQAVVAAAILMGPNYRQF